MLLALLGVGGPGPGGPWPVRIPGEGRTPPRGPSPAFAADTPAKHVHPITRGSHVRAVRQSQNDTLQGEQTALAIKAGGIAGQAPVRADDAMARHDDENRIAPGRPADRPR